MADFAVRLRELRKERGLRQADLASALGIAQTTIANYEQHTRFPDEQMLIKVAGYFEVSLDYLLGRSDVSIHPGTLAASAAVVAPAVSSLSPLAADYLQLLRGGQKEEAFARIEALVDGTMTVHQVYCDVFEPCLKVIGALWEIDEIDISEERYFSEATLDLMGSLRRRVVVPPGPRPGAVLVSAGAERHTIGLKMVGDLLELAGWRTYYLGGIVPIENVRQAVVRESARLLAISVTMPAHVDSVVHMIEVVRNRRSRSVREPLSIIVGGSPFNLDPGLWRRVGADGHAHSCSQAVSLAEELTASTE